MAEISVADISRWQGVINWDEFKNQIQGVVIKATGSDGGLYTDSLFGRNRDEARRTGVPRWFYHYKGDGSAVDQANYFVSVIGGLQPGEGLVLDDENEGKVNTTFAAQFADRVKELTGLNIILYSNLSRFQGVDMKPMRDRDIGAWVAKYGDNTGTVAGAGTPPSLDGSISIIMWQYTSLARVAGVSANTVDMNVFYGDQNQFRAYGAKGNVPAPSAPAPASPSVGNGQYVVQKGDTLSGIATKLGYPGGYQALATANGITNPNLIFPGQVLKVFGGSAGSVSAPTNGSTYTVVRGDTLSGIGDKTGVNWKAIADLNGIKSPYVIYPGQVLKLGGSAPAVTSTYTVVPGDTLSGIGGKTGRNWQDIANLNGIRAPFTIYPNQVLRLP